MIQIKEMKCAQCGERLHLFRQIHPIDGDKYICHKCFKYNKKMKLQNPMNIRACPKCGNRDIHMEDSFHMFCEKCNYKGKPIVLDSENKYELFLNEVRKYYKP